MLRAGTPIPIAWKQQNAPANVRFDVYLSLDGGQSYSPLARNLPATVQNVRWTVPNITTRRARLRIIMRTSDGFLAEDGSTDDLAVFARTGEYRAVFSGPQASLPSGGFLPSGPFSTVPPRKPDGEK